MNSKPSVLDRVSVKEPCREDWDAMRGNDQVRFCSHCAKDVHNLSQMTRAEAETLIRKSNGRLCVRFVRRADASVVTLPPTSSSKRFNDSSSSARASRLAAGAFTAALAVTSPLAAQTSSSPAPPTVNVETTVNQIDKPQIGTGSATITGKVVDPAESVIAGARVTLTDVSGAIRTTETNNNGIYHIDKLPSGMFSLEIDSPGFKNHKVENIKLLESGEQHISSTLEIGGIVEGMMIITTPAQPLLYHDDGRDEIGERIELGGEIKSLLSEAASEDAKQLRVMISDGANVNAANEWGETALMMAARWGSVKGVKALLKAGADINARTEFGVTPLMYAMLNHNEKPAQVLIDAGADVNARDKDSRSALMFACLEGRGETIKVLLDAKAEINARDVNGKTALRFAIENNQEEAVKLLKAAGAVE